MSGHDSKLLAKQRELLLDRLQDFEDTNRGLRKMLKEQHKIEVCVLPSKMKNLMESLASTKFYSNLGKSVEFHLGKQFKACRSNIKYDFFISCFRCHLY